MVAPVAQRFATMAHSYCRAAATGVVLTLRVTPRGGRDAIGGLRELPDGHAAIEVRVRAAASDGAANDAVVALVAKAMAVAKRDVTIASGHASRLKTLTVAGEAAVLAARAQQIAERQNS
jgi:hypothetical protein